MTSCIGVELDARTIRAVRLDGRGGRRRRILEADWDPEGAAAAVQTLRDSLGRARRVAVAVRLPLLLSKQVRLPPLPAAQRRELLRLEPQRYFPIRLDDLAVAVRHDDLVFAAREAAVIEWVRALEALGPVDLVEPGPLALARALGEAGVRDGTVLLDEPGRGMGIVELRGGEVAEVRRLYGSVSEHRATLAALGGEPPRLYLSPWTEDRATALRDALPGVQLAPLPDLPAVPAAFLSAYGAAVGAAPDLDATLAPDDLRGRIVHRRRRELVVAGLAAAAGVLFAIGSLDARRARHLDQVTGELHELQARAAPVLALQERMAMLNQRAEGTARLAAARPDPLRVLAVVSQRLPAGAYLRSLRLSGGEWHIEGFARQAADVMQSLATAPELSDVRVMAATNRAQIAGESNESFALAFKLAPRP